MGNRSLMIVLVGMLLGYVFGPALWHGAAYAYRWAASDRARADAPRSATGMVAVPNLAASTDIMVDLWGPLYCADSDYLADDLVAAIMTASAEVCAYAQDGIIYFAAPEYCVCGEVQL